MSSLHRSCASLAVAALLPGCFHVSIGHVSPRASAETRLRAYQGLRPAERSIAITRDQHHQVVETESSMTLADGTEVHHADDLLPVLDPGSPAAHAARRSASARRGKWAFEVAGMAAIAGGFVVALAGADSDTDETFSRTTTIGLGIVLAGAAMYLTGHWYYARAEESARRAAFATYDESLRQSLQLCVQGMQVVDCRDRAPGDR
ncbi:MAG: hypothetical protein ACTHU0_19060 [Kofleriaceae bacterium]